ncbi:hypothetical protein [Undibacterium sp.]|uniref:hypothetical protein n=1 Tax=Undibacterium sp. TaxID=1914977 RepID=UPI0027317DEC|nr:hypothetical protein [Undibacterium sp.]MDP1979179.1 hypothetical protein [Undibacterium sp.]
MDAMLTVLVPNFANWAFDKTETIGAKQLKEAGIVDPVAYRLGRFITIEPRPVPKWLAKFVPEGLPDWHCFVLHGEYLNMLETEVNGWIEPDEVKSTRLDEVIKHICETTPNCVWVFEPGDEPIDLTYTDKGAVWIFERIKSAMDRKETLQAFAVIEQTRGEDQGSYISSPAGDYAPLRTIKGANMVKTDFEKKLMGILKLYLDGFCTSGEVVHAVVLHFGREKEIDFDLWNSLPEWVKKDVINILVDFSAETEFYLPAHSESPKVVKRNYLALKSWLLKMNIIGT